MVPDWCDISYSFDVSTEDGLDGGKAVRLDSRNRKFTFYYDKDTSLAGDHNNGEYEKEYTVTVTGSAGRKTVVSDTGTFKLTIKNPCINPEYYTIDGYKDPELT